jgi:hypothetical protein
VKAPRQAAWNAYARLAPAEIKPAALKQIRHIFMEGYTTAMRDLIRARSEDRLEEMLAAFKEELDDKRSSTDRRN